MIIPDPDDAVVFDHIMKRLPEGGGFCTKLRDLLAVADKSNRRKIFAAFGETLAQFAPEPPKLVQVVVGYEITAPWGAVMVSQMTTENRVAAEAEGFKCRPLTYAVA